MAAAGWPLLGDGKYGRLDKRYDRKYQALYSYKLTFRFTTDAGCLSYLDGKTFEVESVDFVQEYFYITYFILYFLQSWKNFLKVLPTFLHIFSFCY